MTRDVRVALYGDVNLNILDGSAIWLQSLASTLAATRRCAVTVLCRAGEERDLLTKPLRALPGVTVVNPIDDGKFAGRELSRVQALDVLAELDAEQRFDIVILRGFMLCAGAAANRRKIFHGRLWPYLTDIPQRAEDFDADTLDKLESIAAASRYVLCQTEQLRTHLDSWIPGMAGKTILLEPMIPDRVVTRPPPAAIPPGQPLKLVYVGKYAPAWNTLEMCEATAALRAEGVPVELYMVGDKIHQPPQRPEWASRMEQALTSTPDVHWIKGKSRDDTLTLIGRYDVALGWRSPELDDSLELSTKLLEYGAVGTPAVINRTPMHEELLGADYPLFANTRAELERAITEARDVNVRVLATQRCAALVERFRFSAAAERLSPYIDRAVPPRDLRQRSRPLRIVVACHDFKFFTRIQDHLAAVRGIELRVDAWSAIDKHDEKHSEECLAWADVVICEWCTHNAIWYSKRKRAGQKLIVRLHRFELYGQYVKKIAFDAVDKMVFVGDFYRDEAIARMKWSREKLTVIPNWVDTRDLDRPKRFGAIFNLGMIGIAPKRKRLDRGITVLEKLRAVDDRFQLFIKSKQAWEYPWIWAVPDEQAHYREVFERIQSSPLLRDAVHFDGFGGDVAAWLRKIGFVLSTSDDESFHLSPAEGMASRALPMLLDWKGVEHMYPPEWIHEGEDQIATKILDTVDRGAWLARGEDVRTFIDTRYSVERVCAAWEELVVR